MVHAGRLGLASTAARILGLVVVPVLLVQAYAF
jgi:hypothetical protein